MEVNKDANKGVKAWFLTGNPDALFKTMGIRVEEVDDDGLKSTLSELVAKWIEPTDSKHKQRKPEINKVVATFEKGSSTHAHLLILSRNEIGFESLKKRFPGWHIEPMRGTYSQALDYMYKRGDHSDKASTMLVGPIEWGDYAPRESRDGRKLYELVEEYVTAGMTPSQIYLKDPRLGMHSKMVESYYSAYVQRSIKPIRRVRVIWSFGPSGSGKSYEYVKWCETFGMDTVYFASCSTKNVFDGLEESRHTHLVLDELRENTFKYNELLQILDVFPVRLGARFRDRTATYTDVLITTPLSPEAYYEGVGKSADCGETFAQLMRRIDEVRYCFVESRLDGAEKYRSVSVSASDYKGAKWLIDRANQSMGLS